jgi:DNA polymerase-1
MEYVTNLEGNKETVEAIALQDYPYIAIDIETVNLENTLPVSIAVALSKDIQFYFFNTDSQLLHQIIDKSPLCLFHNASFDVPKLSSKGYNIQHYEDTLLLAYANGYLSNNLESLSLNVLHCNYDSVTTLWHNKDQGNIGVNHLKLASISMVHAKNTLLLWETLPKPELYWNIDRPCVDLVIEMERNGLLIDQSNVTAVEQETVEIVEGLEAKLRSELPLPKPKAKAKKEVTELNLNSNVQMAEVFQAKGILGTRKTKAGKDSMSEESLKPLKNPLADAYLAYKSEMKTISTYIPIFRNVDHEGRIHTSFGHTNTGRWKTSNPNFQNFTNAKEGHKYELRSCIRARDGYSFIAADASQIELRVVAILSGDPLMLEALRTGDLHMATAVLIFGHTDDEKEMKRRRYIAKTGNFAVIYGAEAYKLAETLDIDIAEAQEFLDSYFATYRVLKSWIDKTGRQAKKDGYVTTLFNRIRPIPELLSSNWKEREKAQREAVNTKVQGSAVDIVKLMMLYMRNIMKPSSNLVLQVHDEMVWEVPDYDLEEEEAKFGELALAFPEYPVNVKHGKFYNEVK